MRRAATLLAPRLLGATTTTATTQSGVSAAALSASSMSSTTIAALATGLRSFAADAAVAADSLLKTPLYDLHIEKGGEFLARVAESRERRKKRVGIIIG